MRRNTIVLTAVLFILAIFAWAGWANWEYRRQAAEKLLSGAGRGELVPAPGGDAMNYVSPLNGKPAPAFAKAAADKTGAENKTLDGRGP